MSREKKAPVLTEVQFKRVLTTLRAHEQAARNIALLYFSVALGLRAKELSQLSVRDVLARDGAVKEEVLLTRSTTKGSKQRLVYLTNRDVLKVLKTYLEERRQTDAIALHPDSPLFKSRKGGRFSPNTMQMLFKRMYICAGFPSASSHSGRRTFATTLIEQGVDIKAVSTLMGHATVAMTAQYVADNPARLRRICQEIRPGVSP
jgi:integrase/recombinase XerD